MRNLLVENSILQIRFILIFQKIFDIQFISREVKFKKVKTTVINLVLKRQYLSGFRTMVQYTVKKKACSSSLVVVDFKHLRKRILSELFQDRNQTIFKVEIARLIDFDPSINSFL